MQSIGWTLILASKMFIDSDSCSADPHFNSEQIKEHASKSSDLTVKG